MCGLVHVLGGPLGTLGSSGHPFGAKGVDGKRSSGAMDVLVRKKNKEREGVRGRGATNSAGGEGSG